MNTTAVSNSSAPLRVFYLQVQAHQLPISLYNIPRYFWGAVSLPTNTASHWWRKSPALLLSSPGYMYSSPRLLIPSCFMARLSHLCRLLWLKAGSEEELSRRWIKCPSRWEPASRLALAYHESKYFWCTWHIWRHPEVHIMIQLELLILVEICWLNLPVRLYLSFSTLPTKLP